jgi:uncharacterized protein (UPF0212 family)
LSRLLPQPLGEKSGFFFLIAGMAILFRLLAKFFLFTAESAEDTEKENQGKTKVGCAMQTLPL